jgi:hypothetical protein
MRARNLIAATAIVAAGAIPALTSASAGAMTTTKASVTIIHGIPATPVDVYVNNKKAINNFTFGTVTKPISLAAGTYAVAIRPHGAAATTKPILKGTEKLTAGENATIIANLTAAGTPTLSVFANPTSSVPAGKARIFVRHLAAAPAVDVYAGSTKVISKLANGKQASLVTTAGKLSIAVSVAGQPRSKAVIGPVTLNFAAKATTIVYAIGSATGGTLKAVVQSYAS